jgi:hypothetical protein
MLAKHRGLHITGEQRLRFVTLLSPLWPIRWLPGAGSRETRALDSFDYGLAPRHTHIRGSSRVQPLLQQGIDAAHVALAGDSSGGGLALTLQLGGREQ